MVVSTAVGRCKQLSGSIGECGQKLSVVCEESTGRCAFLSPAVKFTPEWKSSLYSGSPNSVFSVLDNVWSFPVVDVGCGRDTGVFT